MSTDISQHDLIQNYY